MSEPVKNKLRISRPAIGLDEHFSSPDEMRSWANGELQRWNWLPRGVKGIYEQLFSQFNQLATQWQQYPEDRNRENTASQAQSIVEEFFGRGILLYSGDPRAKYIEDLRTKRGVAPAYFAYQSFRTSYPEGNEALLANQVIGVIDAYFFHEGGIAATEAHAQTFAELNAKYKATVDSCVETVRRIETANEKIVLEFNTALEERMCGFTELQEKSETAFAESLKSHQDNLQALENTYNQKLALQAPIEYWRQKELTHRRLAKHMGVCIGSVGSCIRGCFLPAGVLVDEKPSARGRA